MGLSSSGCSDCYVSSHLDSVDRSDRVLEIRIRSCWIKHGSLAAIGPSFSWVSGNSVMHCWVEIETQKGWYCAQLTFTGVILHKHSSLSKINECGLSVGSNISDGNITTQKTCRPSNRTMGEAYDWVYSSNHSYNVVSHNSQDWANEFYSWI